jgi:lambda family phage tail tape measure protein
MADFKVVGKLVIDDKGQLKVLGKKAKGASKELDRVGTSAQTADRRLKGAAQASSGGSKNFSKMAQGINGGLVPAYATLAASLFAIGALFRGLEEAANIKNQTKGMEIFGEATGIAMKGIVADLRAATGGMLDFRNAAQQAQIATAAGFSGEQIIQLGKGAKLASVALGRDLTDSFNRLLRGVTKAEPELLDELGIILRIDDATRNYAQANDLVASKLTISQRRTAVFEEVTRQLANNFSAFEDGADGALNSFSRLQVAFSDIIKGLTAFIGPLEYIAEFLAANTGAAAVIFAGFASSIMKSAFPAITNMTAALQGYQVTSQSALRAEKAKFMQYSVMFKKNAADANLAELKKSRTFKKFLAKRGKDEKAFELMSRTNQRRSISLMIANLQKRQAAGKVINDAELAYFIKTRNQMVGVQAGAFAKMWSITKAGAAGMGAAVTVPALLARVGLAQVGKAALGLAPIFATLGAVISGAFTILTVGFLAKFLYEMVFITKEEKEERKKINDQLELSSTKLKEIQRIGSALFKGMTEDAAEGVDNLNSKLEATFNLINGIRGEKELGNIIGDTTKFNNPGRNVFGSKPDSQISAVSQLLTRQIAGLSALSGGSDFFDELLKQDSFQGYGDKITPSIGDLGPGGLRLGDVLKKHMNDDGTITEAGTDFMIQFFNAALARADTSTVKQFSDDLQKKLDDKGTSGKGIKDVKEAMKVTRDTLKTMGDSYKPTTLDAFNFALTDLANNIRIADNEQTLLLANGKIKADELAKHFQIVNAQYGTNFENNKQAIQFIEARALAIANIINENARILKENSSIKLGTAQLGSRKDAATVFAKQKLKERQFTSDIAAINNTIVEQQEYLLSVSKEDEELASRKLVSLELQLNVLKAQEKEYKRANTIAGQLQDTFQDGLDNTFQSIIDGTAKAKDAFKQLAVVVIQEMQRILAVRMASQIIGMMSGFFGDGTTPGQNMSPVDQAPSILSRVEGFNSTSGGSPLGTGRYGGTFGKKGYASGGIADGPASGYNVLMHGREAIVPLPDGDKIPVQLTGKGQGPVNSVINVTVNNEGDVESSAEESSALGEAIQMAVTREIAEQQRPGGLLSPI